MKRKIVKYSGLLLGGLSLIIPGCAPANNVEAPKEEKIEFDDPIHYDEAKPIAYENPTRVIRAEEESIKIPSKVKLHYHNDDNKCLDRRFYTWVTGVDGLERKPLASTWSSTDMEIELDFSVITDYADMPSLFFIIKMAGTWSGQSEDTELQYVNWQDLIEDDTLEVWTIPGEGTSIEIYGTEAETKLPKITTAKFTDFKTIHCTSTIDEKTGKKWVADKYELYAFDKSYFDMTESAQKANKHHYLFKSGKPSGNEFDIKFNYTAKINVQYMIESVFPGYEDKPVRQIVVSYEKLYEDPRFDQYYTYSGNDLGVTYTEGMTTFKVWSPVSATAVVNIYDRGDPISLGLGGNDDKYQYKMTYEKGGVWTAKIVGDLKGKYYTYSLTHSAGTVEAMDPYAKACGINGLRGYIYDNKATDANPEGWNNVPLKWDGNGNYDISCPQDLSVYEVHIRDLTMDETWVSKKNNKRGTYAAFIESGTTYSANGKTVTTGFDHITDLGVKAVQLLPVFDNDNDERPEKMKFNWGYNPLNYNCVDGGYSTDPMNPLTRIVEYKNLVKAFSENGNNTRVIMDVVYNHVSSASASCFTKVMPKYYFRYTEDWSYYDGSGCSNEVKSDSTMMRKYIVDSLCWWATEYKIKGFRFDLMGLIDTWTLRACKEALYAIDPDIVMYGEGWTSGGYHGKTEWKQNDSGEWYQVNGGAYSYTDRNWDTGQVYNSELIYSQLYASSTSPGQVGAFNDDARDNLRGGNDRGFEGISYPKWGWISQGTGDNGTSAQNVTDGMKGMNDKAPGGNPTQTVNYVSCHDNYTAWDQLYYCLAPNGYNSSNARPVGSRPSVDDLVTASLTAHATVMMGNGIAFIQGGEELYRTKNYKYNIEETKKLMAHNEPDASDAIVRPYPDFVHYSETQVYATADVRMYGSDSEYDIVTHNSYKSPDYVNSFKWDRKISVDGTDTSKYIEVWNKMVSLHDDLPKYFYPDNCDTAQLNCWFANGTSASAGAFAMWNGNEEGTRGYYFVFASRDGGSIGIDLAGTKLEISSKDPKSYSNWTLSMDKYTFLVYSKGM